MVHKRSNYVAKEPDAKGFVHFTSEENYVWNKLYNRQNEILVDRACDEFIEGITKLALNDKEVPQLTDVSKKLKGMTGWELSPVKALISFKEFFDLLSQKKFPAATFIRTIEDLDYLKEPDIFHEIFGHATMLTHQHFADFTESIGKIGAAMSQKERVLLARLYWFTVEFGLINTKQGLRIYGGGILSSKNETLYALESNVPKRQAFDIPTILSTDYRYDEMQKNYFVINSFEEIYNLVGHDLRKIFQEALMREEVKEKKDVRSC